MKTEDKAMYDAREKAIRDYHSAINSALREGEQKGLVEGERSKILMLQEILGIAKTDAEILLGMSMEELSALVAELQQMARLRTSS
jgi:hypothetical protein